MDALADHIFGSIHIRPTVDHKHQQRIAARHVIRHHDMAVFERLDHGVNRIVERPMRRGGQVVGRLLMNLSSSFDHRVVDGMHAAQFIQAMRALLETPALLFVE